MKQVALTNKQYKLLLILVSLGNWMINGIRSGEKGDEVLEEYENMTNLLFSFAKKFGLEKYIRKDKKTGKFLPSQKFEEIYMDRYIEEYKDEIFWSELAVRLAARDVDENEFDSDEEYFSTLEEMEEKYFDEFSKYGLARIEVAKENEILNLVRMISKTKAAKWQN